MRFLKENMILVLLVVAVVLLGGGLLTVRSSVNRNVVDGLLKKRQDMAIRLRRKGGGTLVNKGIVAVERQRVKTTRSDANEIQRRCIEWNRRHCRPLRLPLLDKEEKVVGHVDAFPIEPQKQKYVDYSLRYQFTNEYIRAIDGLRGKLRPAAVPTKEDIAAAAQRWEELIRKKMELDNIRDEGREERDGGPARDERGVRPTWIGGLPPDMPVRRAARAAPIRAADEASVYARRELMKAQARKGCMYADESAFQKVFAIAIPVVADRQLWTAQLNLWVTGDIVEAIIATNREAFGKLPEQAWNVPAAAVKRLLRIEVDSDYFGGKAAGPETPGWDPRDARMRDPMPGMMPEMMPPWGHQMMGQVRPERAAPVTPARPKAMGEGLTGRTVRQDCDVLHYSFTVIMSARYLPSLQRNLMKRNLHTILNVQMAEVAFDENSLYYYGTEPVVQVNMDWELLLLTAWERGTAEEMEPDAPRPVSGIGMGVGVGDGPTAEPVRWKKEFPPLMPVEVLKRIAPSALREVDRRRLAEAAARP